MTICHWFQGKIFNVPSNDSILKKGAKNRFSATEKKVHFSAFWMFAEERSTLQACGIQTKKIAHSHEVSIER